MRNPVFGISDLVLRKSVCSATGTSKNNGIFHTANKKGADQLVWMHRQARQTCLCICLSWSAPDCAIVIHIQQIKFSDSLVT